MVERRDGPNWLRDDDDDDYQKISNALSTSRQYFEKKYVFS